jgi:dUTP pyrophosphatase
MKLVVTKKGRNHYYYQEGDVVKQLSTDTIFTVEKVDIANKKLISTDGQVFDLNTDIKPIVETVEKAQVENRRVYIPTTRDIFFAKTKESAIIPSKIDENGGYDIYACFDEEFIVIEPHQTVMIPTGICSAFSSKWVALLQERGSTGTNGMGQRAGVIDSGYRGEWICPITNENDVPIYISKTVNKVAVYKDRIDYPASKAICQMVLVEVPKMKVTEIPLDKLKEIPSTRGEGKLGSSGK